MNLKLTRTKKNPILGPLERWWENKVVFNPAVLQLGNKAHLIYTARGEDEIGRLGYASFRNMDEVEERLPYPIFMREEW